VKGIKSEVIRTVLSNSTKNRNGKVFYSEERCLPIRGGTNWICKKPYGVKNSFVNYVLVCRIAFR